MSNDYNDACQDILKIAEADLLDLYKSKDNYPKEPHKSATFRANSVISQIKLIREIRKEMGAPDPKKADYSEKIAAAKANVKKNGKA